MSHARRRTANGPLPGEYAALNRSDRRRAARARALLTGAGAAALLAGAAAAQPSQNAVLPHVWKEVAPEATAHPALWPTAHSPVAKNPAMERRVDALLAKMTLEQKVGQTLQPEIRYITPDEVRRYHIGTIENGGGSQPAGDKHASLQTWVKLVQSYSDAAYDKDGPGPHIPLLWATDAVHGHNNVFGATLFPHNIGLGAARDPELVRRIGEATAQEVRATGMDWAFAPTIAVAQDDRWGRTYESYSQDPKLVAQYAGAMVRGLQGEGPRLLDADHVISTAKHFLGDGGTFEGHDQGDTRVDEATLRDVHGAGYVAAVSAGVQSVMSSYSSWNGVKMHGNGSLLTGVLKDRFGFDGLVIGDWNGHGQVPGCTKADCPAALDAGVDVYNVPEDWRALYANLVAEVKSGVVPMARLDDAVRRVLRVKMRAHAFEEARPAERPHAGDPARLGSPEHRALARLAAAESLVLLKNNGHVLPLKGAGALLIAGEAADSVAQQTGGWTLSWQGNDNTPADFPGATSIRAGLEQAVAAAGGRATYSLDGSFTTKPDVAVVVFGETPYAEFQGDQADLILHPGADAALAAMRRLHAAGVPVVAVFLSGRPLYQNPQINAADAYVAAFLPGSEGAGVADVLVGDARGAARRDFRGKLSFNWPSRPDQTLQDAGRPGHDPQFAFGYGLTYADRGSLPHLQEVALTTAAGERGALLANGRGVNGWSLSLGDAAAPVVPATGSRAALTDGALTLEAVDHRRQEDARRLRWKGSAPAWAELRRETPLDLSREANGDVVLELGLKVDAAPAGPVSLSLVSASGEHGTAPVGPALSAAGPGAWTSVRVLLKCFGAAGADLAHVHALRLETAGALDVTVADARLSQIAPGDACPGATR